ncbi:unnamed protein product [Adineta steineri]|uniref:Endonuclease/exonuclease/phosphatase domain-containing protein n=1 Tax=Adineta steineri TaxID=433720 RepID=A0A819MEZ9_9BILA|nr:unnamed protein product [Adineta steineri]
MTVRIVSYNIFAPVYADRPDHYFKCKPEFLKSDYRWNLIRCHLKKEIDDHENTIICLQEVSLWFLPKLELFFRQLNYIFFHNLFGQQRNDYLSGVGIAIPISMQLSSISIIKISDHIRSMTQPREKNTNSSTLESDLNQPISDSWEIAMSTPHVFICLQIIIDNKPLYIGTYHMPCFYKEPNVMAIHASVMKDLMFQLTNGEKFILAGDFNIKPQDTSYQALIGKDCVDFNLPQSNTYQITYQCNTKQILKSAYLEKNGIEPKYTDFSHKKGSTRFCETLDYIFFNGDLTVEQVLELPDDPTCESYPDETHPSDHLMIAATFRLL